MNRHEYDRLQTELAALNDLLEMVPEEAVIDRISLQSRKSRVERRLENDPPPQRWPSTAKITFDGLPVVSDQGINANFGGEAMNSFAKFITSLAASQGTTLGERGVIPNQDYYQIVITGTSLGSFSFDIEELSDQQSSYLEGPSPVEEAIKQAKEIMKSSTLDPEALAEAIEETDNRALNDLRGFIELLAESEAVCSLSSEGDTFGFDSVGQVQTALVNLSQDNVIEDEIDIRGYFQGYLPKGRRAEFIESSTREVISARVGRAIPEAERINTILQKEVLIRARTRRVGSSNPRYTVLDFKRE